VSFNAYFHSYDHCIIRVYFSLQRALGIASGKFPGRKGYGLNVFYDRFQRLGFTLWEKKIRSLVVSCVVYYGCGDLPLSGNDETWPCVVYIPFIILCCAGHMHMVTWFVWWTNFKNKHELEERLYSVQQVDFVSQRSNKNPLNSTLGEMTPEPFCIVTLYLLNLPIDTAATFPPFYQSSTKT